MPRNLVVATLEALGPARWGLAVVIGALGLFVFILLIRKIGLPGFGGSSTSKQSF